MKGYKPTKAERRKDRERVKAEKTEKDTGVMATLKGWFGGKPGVEGPKPEESGVGDDPSVPATHVPATPEKGPARVRVLEETPIPAARKGRRRPPSPLSFGVESESKETEIESVGPDPVRPDPEREEAKEAQLQRKDAGWEARRFYARERRRNPAAWLDRKRRHDAYSMQALRRDQVRNQRFIDAGRQVQHRTALLKSAILAKKNRWRRAMGWDMPETNRIARYQMGYVI